MLSGELAVPFSRNPLHAGLNSLFRVFIPKMSVGRPGHRATNAHEPRQVRKEAAISDAVCVVDIPGLLDSTHL